MKKLLLGLIIFIVVLLIGLGVALFIFLGSSSEEDPKKEVTSSVNDLTYIGTIVPLETFTVNLLSARSYLKTDISLEFIENEEISTEATNKMPVIRDVIIRILSSMTPEELFTEKGKDKLKEKIKEEVSQELSQKVKNVYFTDFVMQI